MKKLLYIILFISISISGFSQYEDAVKYAETITQEDLRDYLTILASDAMEGRETGERGQKMAAAFIAYHFESLGLKPVVKNGDTYSYYQRFDLERSSPGEIYATINGKKLVNGEDIIYWGRKNMSAESSIEAVFAGNGSDEDFAEVDTKGKAAVILAAGSGFQQWRTLSTKSENAGSGLTFLVIADDQESFSTTLNQFRRFNRASLGFKEEESASSGIFLISQSIADELFKSSPGQLKNASDESASGKKGSLKKIKPGKVSYFIKRNIETVSTENVIGLLEGTDKKDEILVISAHYDHIGKRGENINNGADDDGSGTVSVMEIAQAFAEAKKAGKGPRRSILFITVTGEEKGLLGSQYYVEHPVFPLESTVADLNIDMVGRVDPQHKDNKEFVYLVGSDKLSTELHELSEKANETFTDLDLDYTYNDEKHPDRIYYRSDHWNFAKNGIPIIFYFDGIHEDYHKPTDTVDKIEFDLLQKRASLVYHTAWVLANKDERLVVDKLQETSIERQN